MDDLYGDDILLWSHAVTADWCIIVERISTGDQVESGTFRGAADAALRYAKAAIRTSPTPDDLRVVGIIRNGRYSAFHRLDAVVQ
jgi:hypothetical protein